MFKLTLDQLPKLVKDVPWFIMKHPNIGIDSMNTLVANKTKLLGILEMAKAEPEAFELVEWLCEHRSMVGVDVNYSNFIIYIKPKDVSSAYSSPVGFMSQTMPDKLKEAFVKRGIIPL